MGQYEIKVVTDSDGNQYYCRQRVDELNAEISGLDKLIRRQQLHIKRWQALCVMIVVLSLTFIFGA